MVLPALIPLIGGLAARTVLSAGARAAGQAAAKAGAQRMGAAAAGTLAKQAAAKAAPVIGGQVGAILVPTMLDAMLRGEPSAEDKAKVQEIVSRLAMQRSQEKGIPLDAAREEIIAEAGPMLEKGIQAEPGLMKSLAIWGGGTIAGAAGGAMLGSKLAKGALRPTAARTVLTKPSAPAAAAPAAAAPAAAAPAAGGPVLNAERVTADDMLRELMGKPTSGVGYQPPRAAPTTRLPSGPAIPMGTTGMPGGLPPGYNSIQTATGLPPSMHQRYAEAADELSGPEMARRVRGLPDDWQDEVMGVARMASPDEPGIVVSRRELAHAERQAKRGQLPAPTARPGRSHGPAPALPAAPAAVTNPDDILAKEAAANGLTTDQVMADLAALNAARTKASPIGQDDIDALIAALK